MRKRGKDGHLLQVLMAQMIKKKKIACNAGDPGSIPGLGRFAGEGNGYPLQYSSLEISVATGLWWLGLQRVRPEDVTEWLAFSLCKPNPLTGLTSVRSCVNRESKVCHLIIAHVLSWKNKTNKQKNLCWSQKGILQPIAVGNPKCNLLLLSRFSHVRPGRYLNASLIVTAFI